MLFSRSRWVVRERREDDRSSGGLLFMYAELGASVLLFTVVYDNNELMLSSLKASPDIECSWSRFMGEYLVQSPCIQLNVVCRYVPDPAGSEFYSDILHTPAHCWVCWLRKHILGRSGSAMRSIGNKMTSKSIQSFFLNKTSIILRPCRDMDGAQ